MNYLIRLWGTDSNDVEYNEYHTVQANSEKEAERIGDRMAEMILETEHFMNKKWGYEYEGKYANCYSILIGAIK